VAASARIAQEQRLIGNHADAAHLVDRRPDFHTAINFALGQDDRIGSHLGKNHRLGSLEGLGGEHFHTHTAASLLSNRPAIPAPQTRTGHTLP
jgi:hypothetical protein